MTTPSETLYPKTGSKASNYINDTFFNPKSISTAPASHGEKAISNNLNHFAEALKFL